MMIKRLIYFTIFFGALLTQAHAQDYLPGKVAGDSIRSGQILTTAELAALTAEMEPDAKLSAKVKGKVVGVCTKKGCWMTLQLPGNETMHVNFKDYAFFVPTDIQGREVIIEGTVIHDVTSVERLQHYAEDAGKSKEEIAAITEPKKELKFTATGVVMPGLE